MRSFPKVYGILGIGLFAAAILLQKFPTASKEEAPEPNETAYSLSSPVLNSSPQRIDALPLEKSQNFYSYYRAYAVRKTTTEKERFFVELKERFARNYPSKPARIHRDPVHDEIVIRIGILKSLAKETNGDFLFALYKFILKNSKEHWLVKRQALHNARPFLSKISERERMEILGSVDSRTLSLAAYREEELLSVPLLRGDGSRSPLSVALSNNDYSKLPCPSEEEFHRLAASVNWVGGKFSCDFSPVGKLGRLLYFLEKLDLSPPQKGEAGSLPKGEAGSLQKGEAGSPSSPESYPVIERLRRPMEFLASHSRRMDLDFNQSDTIAYNLSTKGHIFLGALFFELTPFEALGVLIHEARHSAHEEEQGHSFCVQGDIPGSGAGCDQRFTLEKDAGAYTYGLMFSVMLAHHASATQVDREFLLSDALTLLGRRFNRLPPEFAQFQDAIAGLTPEGALVVLHPYAKHVFRIPLPNNLPKARAIRYDDRTGGLYLYDMEGSLHTWSWREGFGKYRPDLLEGKFRVKEFSKLFVPYQTYSFNGFLTRNNQLFYLDNEPKTGKWKVLEFPFQAAEFTISDFFTADVKYSYVLGTDGKLRRVRYWGSDPDFGIVPWQGALSFVQGTGGVLRDSLFILDNQGKLYQQEVREGEPKFVNGMVDEAAITEELSLRLSEFQSREKAISFQEGREFRALLTESGVSIQYYIENGSILEIPFGTSSPKIESFALIKLLRTSEALRMESLEQRSKGKEVLADFASRCAVANPKRDPWLKLGVGVNAEGDLVFDSLEKECVRVALPERVRGKLKDFEFSAKEERGGKLDFFPPTILKLRLTSGEEISLRPYEVWSQ